MRIGLIAMSGVRVRTPELAALGVTLPQFVNRGKVIASLPSLGLLTVAAMTPDDVDVAYREVDELPADGDLEPFDLVGISSFTAQIDEAYSLADRYRGGGTPVVLGGLHVSMMPDEAAQHADAIVVNGGEGVWSQVVADFRAGHLRKRYNGARDGVFKEPLYVEPRFDLLRGRPYNRITVQTSRGCPLNCEFCAASLRITERFQQKPVARAIAEIKAAMQVTDQPFFELADDNTFLNKSGARSFCAPSARLTYAGLRRPISRLQPTTSYWIYSPTAAASRSSLASRVQMPAVWMASIRTTGSTANMTTICGRSTRSSRGGLP